MAFDPALHTFDPETGFLVDKVLGHRIGLEPAPIHLGQVEPAQYPKWVEVHGSHLNGGVAQDFEQTERARDGVYRVLVHDEEEEKLAIAERSHDKPPVEETAPPPPAYQAVTHIPLAVAHDDPEHKAIGVVEDAHMHEQAGLDGFDPPIEDDPSHGHEVGGVTGLGPPHSQVEPPRQSVPGFPEQH